jgi:cysteine desulfurase
MDRIYLDYAATTPVDQRVLEKMFPYFSEQFGNPSSIHFWGQQAEHALDQARRTVALNLNTSEEEIVFTSCGTESDNLAIRGALFNGEKKHLLISPVEHHAVLSTAEQLAKNFGFMLEILPVDEFGRVDPSEVEKRIRKDTALVSVIYGNNEIGTINPVAEIGKICRQKGVLFHSDAVQAAAHLKMDVERDHIDLLAIGAHKFYGPKGVGALFVRNGTQLLPAQTGGKQEKSLRAGTQNIPYIIGLAEALQITNLELADRKSKLESLRNHLIGRILEEVPETHLIGHPTQRLPNHASFAFKGLDGNFLLMLLDNAGFACSSGSACKVGTPEPSDVLKAIGLPDEWALGSLRITLGKDSQPEQIQQFCDALPALVHQARLLRSTQ